MATPTVSPPPATAPAPQAPRSRTALAAVLAVGVGPGGRGARRRARLPGLVALPRGGTGRHPAHPGVAQGDRDRVVRHLRQGGAARRDDRRHPRDHGGGRPALGPRRPSRARPGRRVRPARPRRHRHGADVRPARPRRPGRGGPRRASASGGSCTASPSRTAPRPTTGGPLGAPPAALPHRARASPPSAPSRAGLAGRAIASSGTSPGSVALPPPATPAAPPPVGADFVASGTPTWLTPAGDFYRIDTALSVPRLSTDSWSLRIHGMVDREVTLTFDQLRAHAADRGAGDADLRVERGRRHADLQRPVARRADARRARRWRGCGPAPSRSRAPPPTAGTATPRSAR